MVVDAVDEIAAAQPNFPWADYDVEDQGDVDGDGDLFEPDGVIDHFVIVHAGTGEEGGGGAEGTYALWAHSSGVDAATGGYAIPGGKGVRVFNYIAQPEDGGVGVFAHEYGHDLGLPDLYDTSGAADSDVDFWDLMSSGSHSGELIQSLPTSMGAWDRFVLGWIDPEVIDVGANAHAVQLGQAALTPRGTKDAVRVNLPTKAITLADPHSGAQMWWSNNDQSWADVRLSRALDVPAGGDVRFWLWDNYVTEEDWDYGFVEVSTNGGSTWTQLKVRDETGALVSTDDGDPDPHGRLHDYGDLRYGLTGSSDGWRHDYVDLGAYAGTKVDLRLRYATDASFEERGWFADDFALTANGATVWTDDVEAGGDGWTAEPTSFAGTSGAGWILHSGTFLYNHYYLAEWRNFSGFDNGLRYAYDTNYARTDAGGEWNVEKYAVQRARDARLVPGPPVREQPRHGADLRGAEHRREGDAPARRLALRPAPADGSGRRARRAGDEQHPVAAAELERRVRDARDVPAAGVHRVPGVLAVPRVHGVRRAAGRPGVHGREGVVPRARVHGHRPPVPRLRRIGRRPVEGPVALHDSDRRPRRESAAGAVRIRPRRRFAARQRRPVARPRPGEPDRRLVRRLLRGQARRPEQLVCHGLGVAGEAVASPAHSRPETTGGRPPRRPPSFRGASYRRRLGSANFRV